MNNAEIEAAADALGLAPDAFIARYTRLHADRRGLSLTEKEDGACIFLEDHPPACRIQEAKPRQCRDFPLGWRFDGAGQRCAALSRPRAGSG